MHKFTSNDAPNVEDLRTRLQKMTGKQLREFGLAAAYMCSKKANPAKPPQEAYAAQLEEARKEWKLRQDQKKKPA
jgi:hypothetical protein